MRMLESGSKYLVIFLVAVLSLPLIADEKADAVDKLFAEWDTDHTPGAVVAVYQDGKIVLARGYGMANLELSVPLTPNSVFHIASTSKQFTAACIAMLSLRGKLDLDASVRDYVPELPELYQPVTINQLVHHTSGVRDIVSLQRMRGIRDFQYYNNQDVLNLLCRQKALNFPAGDKLLYSNSGYVLLAVVVERVSGQSLAEFARENIFEPLGMKNSLFRDSIRDIVPHRSMAYGLRDDGSPYVNESIFEVVGPCGVFTSVEDLFLWDCNFYDNKLDEGLIELMMTKGTLNDGTETDYTFGLSHDRLRGMEIVYHAGGYVGFRSDLMRFPGQHFTVVCLSNATSINPTEICMMIAQTYLAEAPGETAAESTQETTTASEPVYTELPEERLTELAGHYRNTRTGRRGELVSQEGGLMYVSPEFSIHFKPLSESAFHGVLNGLDIRIKFEETPVRCYFQIFVNGENQGTMQKFNPFEPTEESLAEYAGSYYNEDIDMTYRIEFADGQLSLHFGNSREAILEPREKDGFHIGSWLFDFQRDGEKITGFIVNTGRANGLFFEKK